MQQPAIIIAYMQNNFDFRLILEYKLFLNRVYVAGNQLNQAFCQMQKEIFEFS